MRILVHDYAGHSFAPSLSRNLAARGHEVVHAFAGGLQTPRGTLQRRADDPDGLAFRELPMDPNYVRDKYRFLRRRGMELRYGRDAADFVRDWRPDAVLSGNTPTETQEPILQATLAAGGRFFYWVQDFYSLAVGKLLRRKIPIAGGLVGAWYRRLDASQFQRSTRVVTITEDFTPILGERFGIDPDRVEVVPNWAAIEELPTHPKDNAWSRRHGLHDKFVFLYTGTIGMKHDPALLLELARRHLDQPAVRVVVTSEGLGAEWLKRESAAAGLDNLVILPFQPFAELAEVLAAGDVLVGLLEPDAGIFSVPSKVLSYLCAKRPLLLAVPPANLASRLVDENEAGLCVAPGERDAFLDAADELLGSPDRRHQLATAGRRYAEQRFHIAGVGDRFESILAAT